MKKILKYLTFIALPLLVSISCNYNDTNFDLLHKNIDPNATYYVQFTDASKSLETGVSLAGDLVDINTTVAITLMGTPQSEDIVVNLTLDPSSTIDPSMFNLSSSSITIPAGETSGSVDLTTLTGNMPVGETLKFILDIDAGDYNSPNANGTKLVYMLKRIQFCPLVNGAADLAGTWNVTADDNAGNPYGAGENSFTAVANGTDKLDVTGLSEAFINNFWGESVIAGNVFTMDVAANGFVTIPRQYIYTTDYNGTSYDYEIEGSGTWTNCGAKPTLTISYDIYYAGASEGLASTYAAYLTVSHLGGTFTLN